MKHVIQQLEVEIKGLDNMIRHVSDKKKLAEQRLKDLQSEADSHASSLAILSDQKAKLHNAIEGIKAL